MDSQVPAYWGIVACVGGLGLLFGIKKIGPYYLKGLEAAFGVSPRECIRNFLGIVVVVAAIGGIAGSIALFVNGGNRLHHPEKYAVKEYTENKEEKEERSEQLQVLIEGQEQKGLNWIFYGGGAVFGTLFLAWTSIVLLNYDDVVRKLNRDRNA